jgi:hypothetical protein
VKTYFFALNVFVCLAALFAGRTELHAADPNSGGTIQVQINDPAKRDHVLDVRLSTEFVLRIHEAFRQRGYTGAVVGVTGYSKPDPDCYLLTVDLAKWQVNRSGKVSGTFAATLTTEHVTRALGVFKELALRWDAQSGHFAPAEGADDSDADAPIRELYEAMAATRLVPGMSDTREVAPAKNE